MINPINPTSFTYSGSRISTRTAAETAPQEVAADAPAKTATSETRVELHSYRSRSSTDTYSPPNALVPNANSNATSTAEVAAPQTVEAPTEANNPYSQTILSFIELQLQRDVADGATNDELQSRLQAGLDGFLKGFGEAFDQLSASGVLDDATKAAIQETYSQVLDGVTALADKLGLENPVKDSDRLPEAPLKSDTASGAGDAASIASLNSGPSSGSDLSAIRPEDQLKLNIIQQFQSTQDFLIADDDASAAEDSGAVETAGNSSSIASANRYRYGVSNANEFNFKVRTSEGDEVTVSISASRSGEVQYGADDSGHSSLAIHGEQNSAFSFAIKGDLNEDELQAINDLLGKVGDISSAFFDGNLSQAFDLASNLNLEGDKIESFALNLKMTQSEQASVPQDVYSPKLVGRSAERNQLSGFANMLESAGAMADELKLPRSLVADLLDYVTRETRPEDASGGVLGAIAEKYFGNEGIQAQPTQS